MSRMSINYTVLTDHSYSLRIDQEKISLKQQRDMKRKKPRRVTQKKTNRTVSIDRSSSDKENNSSISLNKRKNSTKKNSFKSDAIDGIPSLSIEERVKLRRTKPFPSAMASVSNPIKRRVKPQMKSKKFFLGSGLDLDNIVLGNRRRRSVQT